MKIAAESMEMALGAIPHPGRVPKQRFYPQNLSSMAAALWNFSWMEASSLGFSRRGQYIGGRARSVDT
jgi:hypothetical protein